MLLYSQLMRVVLVQENFYTTRGYAKATLSLKAVQLPRL